jgi:DNA-dependent RNA polymerase auxiliary subunit epsilon
MYENGYNIFYIPSLDDVLVDTEDDDEVIVSMD